LTKAAAAAAAAAKERVDVAKYLFLPEWKRWTKYILQY
jgi:hypothetical protein